ncbi:hypothetical protein ABTX81_03890 [Kitasatospora sp. NPDC097605]|uniref:hypothetical protein n=1 Tax=Kitasatospora sp. NPDC097605 TaxID=3157226 RepID=UPI0033228480
MTVNRSGIPGRHRGEHRDPVGTVLTGVRALGHVVTVFLLGTSVLNHLEAADHQGLAHPARSVPDHEPPA